MTFIQERRVGEPIPLFIVFNLGARHGDAESFKDTIRSTLEQAGRAYEIFEVDDPRDLPGLTQHAVARAKADKGAIVGAGGDGTMNAVAQAAYDNNLPFGVLPHGTFNYFSRVNDIPLEIAESSAALLTAEVRPTQVGMVNGHLFLVNASMGLYPRLLEDREAYKKQFGRNRAVAVLSALMTLLRDHRPLTVELDLDGTTKVMRTTTLFTGNNRLQLEQIGLPEAPCVDRQQLAAIAVRPVSALAMLGLGLRGALGQLGDADHVLSFAFQRMRVRPRLPYGRRQIKVAMDGEICWLNTPLTFAVAPRPLLLLAPTSKPARAES
jgi:diacylglycerol kinase family enzyme